MAEEVHPGVVICLEGLLHQRLHLLVVTALPQRLLHPVRERGALSLADPTGHKRGGDEPGRVGSQTAPLEYFSRPPIRSQSVWTKESGGVLEIGFEGNPSQVNGRGDEPDC